MSNPTPETKATPYSAEEAKTMSEAFAFTAEPDNDHGRIAATLRAYAAQESELSTLRERVRELESGGWISVEERLPEVPDYSVTYAVITTSGKVMALDWAAHKYAATERGRAPRWQWHGRNSPWAVTHWRPLPAPPAITNAPEVKLVNVAVEQFVRWLLSGGNVIRERSSTDWNRLDVEAIVQQKEREDRERAAIRSAEEKP